MQPAIKLSAMTRTEKLLAELIALLKCPVEIV
jgi:hypothetical protein